MNPISINSTGISVYRTSSFDFESLKRKMITVPVVSNSNFDLKYFRIFLENDDYFSNPKKILIVEAPRNFSRSVLFARLC